MLTDCPSNCIFLNRHGPQEECKKCPINNKNIAKEELEEWVIFFIGMHYNQYGQITEIINIFRDINASYLHLSNITLEDGLEVITPKEYKNGRL